jgi:argininosuccinate lyase
LTASVIGCLARPPHAVLFELLYEPQLASDRRSVLPHLLRIDAAHVVMLARQGLLARPVAAELLAVNDELTQSQAAGGDVVGAPHEHRGLYFLYEQAFIGRLGEAVGGAAHMARSRNDINATVTRMRLRDDLLGVLADVEGLMGAMEQVATAHLDTLLCGFTHQQPAQPTTLGHYLTGVLSEITRSAEWLDAAYGAVNSSPLGAAAGFGTSFRTDRGMVAKLLGFDDVVDNAADAVASRDYVVHVLSALAMVGVTVTRLATDLQAWAGAAYGFVGWPDDLVGTSSIMPQKRNPFVLENVRGQCSQAVGALVNVLTGMKNVPFSNSVEIGLEAMAGAWPALEAGRKALRLTRLMVEEMEVSRERMLSFLRGTQATLTAVAELLVSRHGLAFRTAHDALGRLVRESPGPLPAKEVRVRLESILQDILARPVTLDETELEARLDPRAGVQAAAFGGGPAPATVRAQLRSLSQRRERLSGSLRQHRARLREAESLLCDAASEVRGVQSPGDRTCNKRT